MIKNNDKKDALTHVTVNVLDFQSGNLMVMEMASCGYDKIDDLSKMDKGKAIYLKYSKRSTDTPVPMKYKKKLLHLIWCRDYTVSLKLDKLMSTDEWTKQTKDDYEGI